MLENRFLQTFCAVGASAVLVFGTLILLTSTAPWKPPAEIAAEPSTPDAARLLAQAEAPRGEYVAKEPSASDQAEANSFQQVEEADRTFTASTLKEPDEERSEETSEQQENETLAATGMPLDQDSASTDGASDGANAPALNDDYAAREEGSGGEAVQATAMAGGEGDVASKEVAAALASMPPRVTASDRNAAATDQIAELLTSLPPRAIARDKSNAATDQIADILATLPPAPPVPVASAKNFPATAEAAAVPAATKQASAVGAIHPSAPAGDRSVAANAEIAALPAAKNQAAAVVAVAAPSPPPPLPKRKPVEGPAEPKVAALPAPVKVAALPAHETLPTPRKEKPAEPEETKGAVAQKSQAQPVGKSLWQAMTLAPADKPSTALTKAPINKPSAAGYASKIWSQLARHKPRAGQRGSASVSFAIGANGALGAVQLARSSGNSRLDQLALQTVRSAGPFPPPPAGAVSYTIRIDFQ